MNLKGYTYALMGAQQGLGKLQSLTEKRCNEARLYPQGNGISLMFGLRGMDYDS